MEAIEISCHYHHTKPLPLKNLDQDRTSEGTPPHSESSKTSYKIKQNK